MNHIQQAAARGKTAAVCQCCGTQSPPTDMTDKGEPDLWSMPPGWSEAPYPASYVHRDGSKGSRYTCPACNKQLRAGRALPTRGGQFTRLVA
jgi:hypothetical protein